MKRILYFYHENPLEKNAGNKTRVLNLLKYFKSRDLSVDFVSLKGFASNWGEDSKTAFEKSGLCHELFLLERKPKKNNFFSYCFQHTLPNVGYKMRKGKLSIFLTAYLQKEFEKILKKKSYDYILINYVYWAELIKNRTLIGNAFTIVDTHDFTTPRHVGERGFELGGFFEEEINQLNKFDCIWAISSDEQFVFGQFCKNKVQLVPVMLNKPHLPPPDKEKEYDFVYVASDNPHNREASEWFFNKVYPFLPSSYRFLVVGKITRHIQNYPNLIKISFIEDLEQIYLSSKIAICPMLNGTGVKIKVAEALSYGLPVVCTTRGIDGLPNKINNGCLVADNPEEFARHMMDLIQNPIQYQEISQQGFNLFLNHFETRKIYQNLDRLFL